MDPRNEDSIAAVATKARHFYWLAPSAFTNFLLFTIEGLIGFESHENQTSPSSAMYTLYMLILYIALNILLHSLNASATVEIVRQNFNILRGHMQCYQKGFFPPTHLTLVKKKE